MDSISKVSADSDLLGSMTRKEDKGVPNSYLSVRIRISLHTTQNPKITVTKTRKKFIFQSCKEVQRWAMRG